MTHGLPIRSAPFVLAGLVLACLTPGRPAHAHPPLHGGASFAGVSTPRGEVRSAPVHLSSDALESCDPCDESGSWRRAICAFARENLVHSAWGFAHGKRNYLLGKALAKADGIPVDDEVLFAASMLHDVGGFEPYRQEGVDHAVRSAQVVPEILTEAGFPADKIEAVAQAVGAHAYYDPDLPTTPEGLVLRDADVLDFLGVIGATGILSLAEREAVAPDLTAAVRILRQFRDTLPGRLSDHPRAQELGRLRAAELTLFLDRLEDQTAGLSSL